MFNKRQSSVKSTLLLLLLASVAAACGYQLHGVQPPSKNRAVIPANPNVVVNTSVCKLEDCPLPRNFDYLTQGRIKSEDDRLYFIFRYKKMERSRQDLMHTVYDSYNKGLLTSQTLADYQVFLAWSDHLQYHVPFKDWPQYQSELNKRLDAIEAELQKDLSGPLPDNAC